MKSWKIHCGILVILKFQWQQKCYQMSLMQALKIEKNEEQPKNVYGKSPTIKRKCNGWLRNASLS